MARLMRKTVRGHEYWYAVESKRVTGNPRIVWQRYLGKMDDIIARCLQGPGAYDAQSAHADHRIRACRSPG